MTVTGATAAAVTIIKRESTGNYRWLQFLVVSDQRVAIVDMVPALLGGWNIGRVSLQGADDWPNMTQASIVAWKRTHDDRAHILADSDLSADFRRRLLTAAQVHP